MRTRATTPTTPAAIAKIAASAPERTTSTGGGAWEPRTSAESYFDVRLSFGGLEARRRPTPNKVLEWHENNNALVGIALSGFGGGSKGLCVSGVVIKLRGVTYKVLIEHRKTTAPALEFMKDEETDAVRAYL